MTRSKMRVLPPISLISLTIYVSLCLPPFIAKVMILTNIVSSASFVHGRPGRDLCNRCSDAHSACGERGSSRSSHVHGLRRASNNGSGSAVYSDRDTAIHALYIFAVQAGRVAILVNDETTSVVDSSLALEELKGRVATFNLVTLNA